MILRWTPHPQGGLGSVAPDGKFGAYRIAESSIATDAFALWKCVEGSDVYYLVDDRLESKVAAQHLAHRMYSMTDGPQSESEADSLKERPR